MRGGSRRHWYQFISVLEELVYIGISDMKKPISNIPTDKQLAWPTLDEIVKIPSERKWRREFSNALNY